MSRIEEELLNVIAETHNIVLATRDRVRELNSKLHKYFFNVSCAVEFDLPQKITLYRVESSAFKTEIVTEEIEVKSISLSGYTDAKGVHYMTNSNHIDMLLTFMHNEKLQRELKHAILEKYFKHIQINKRLDEIEKIAEALSVLQQQTEKQQQEQEEQQQESEKDDQNCFSL